MKKILIFIALALLAREDPFELKVVPKTSPQSIEGAIIKPLGKIEVTLPTTARVLKEVKFVYQKLDGSIETESVKIDSGIDWHYPINISQVQNLKNIELQEPFVRKIKDFDFTIIGKQIRIYSPYKMAQIFVLPKPYRIVIDLKRGTESINEKLNLKRVFFQELSIGTHKDFYRVTLQLDGQYTYDLSQDKKGYIITLK